MPLTSPPKGGFRITRRHYDIILKQGLDLLPIEAGGFLGGDIETGTIKAIFPIYNQHLEVQTDTFGFMPDDLGRARSFFKKHNLEYFSMYHTHPKGIAYPSQTDIKAGHWFHFILSLYILTILFKLLLLFSRRLDSSHLAFLLRNLTFA